MTDQYQEMDWEVVDYHIYELDERVLDRQEGTPLRLRGPSVTQPETGNYFVCIGAAQTFGRFCLNPYPEILGRMLGMPSLNLGRGGAGFSFFSQENERLLEYVNRSRFAVIQIMAARSEGNDLFDSRGLGYYYRMSDGSGIGCDAAFRELLALKDPALLKDTVEQTRDNWFKSCCELLERISVPKILFWFSTRKPAYRESLSSDLDGLFGEFPQLVNASMINRIRGKADAYVECISKRGLPQEFKSRFTGQTVTITDPWSGTWEKNWYYPSPRMHKHAAKILYRSCRKYFQAQPTPRQFTTSWNFRKYWV